MDEIGKMLGGWSGQLSKQNSSNSKSKEKWCDLRTKKNRLLSFHLLSSRPLLLSSHDFEPFLLQLKILRLPSRSRLFGTLLYHHPLNTLRIESNSAFINALDSEPSNFIFWRSSYTTLPETLITDTLDVWILISAVGNRNRRHIRLLSVLSYHPVVEFAIIFKKIREFFDGKFHYGVSQNF